MNFELDLAIRKQAKTPHELYMFNLAAFHLLMTPATIALGIGIVGVLLPFSLSLLMILYT